MTNSIYITCIHDRHTDDKYLAFTQEEEAKRYLNRRNRMNEIIKVGTKFEYEGQVFTVTGLELFKDDWAIKTRVIFDKPMFSSRPKILASTLFNAMKDGDLKIIEE